MGRLHPNAVTGSADPAARRAKAAFNTVSASAVGLEFGISVIVGALIGTWLDGKAGTAPWLLIAFTIIGFVAGLRSLLRAVRKLHRDADQGRRDGGSEEGARG